MVRRPSPRQLASRRIAAALGVLFLAAGLASCSDDGGDDEDLVLEDGESSASGTEGADESDEPKTDGTDGEGSGGTATTLAGGAFAEGCAEFNEAFGALGTSIGAGGGELDPDAISEFEALIEGAPEDVQDDFLVYLDAFRQYAVALEEAGVDPNDPSSISPEDQEQLAALTEVFGSEEFLEATQGINEYVSSDCGGG